MRRVWGANGWGGDRDGRGAGEQGLVGCGGEGMKCCGPRGLGSEAEGGTPLFIQFPSWDRVAKGEKVEGDDARTHGVV